jgi:hypothetical protein
MSSVRDDPERWLPHRLARRRPADEPARAPNIRRYPRQRDFSAPERKQLAIKKLQLTKNRRLDPLLPGTADSDHLFFDPDHLWIDRDHLWIDPDHLFL